MRRLIVLTALFAAAAPGAALAQSAVNAAGLRYLSWPGKPAPVETAARTVLAAPAPAPAPRTEAPAVDAAPLTRRPARAPDAPASHGGLTPASAFYTPQPQPEPQPVPAQPEPQPYAAAASAPVAAPPAPEPTPMPAPVADPMAPRRDAPIFRLQPQAASLTAPADNAQAAPGPETPTPSFQTAAAPTGQSARYYSVHRQAGHEPDAIRTPQPVYLDALPVEMTQTPSSADLAEPQAPPALMRAADGSLRALPQTEADALP